MDSTTAPEANLFLTSQAAVRRTLGLVHCNQGTSRGAANSEMRTSAASPLRQAMVLSPQVLCVLRACLCHSCLCSRHSCRRTPSGTASKPAIEKKAKPCAVQGTAKTPLKECRRCAGHKRAARQPAPHNSRLQLLPQTAEWSGVSTFRTARGLQDALRWPYPLANQHAATHLPVSCHGSASSSPCVEREGADASRASRAAAAARKSSWKARASPLRRWNSTRRPSSPS